MLGADRRLALCSPKPVDRPLSLTFHRRLAEQLARPNGQAGRLLGAAMDLANRKPLRLALDLLAPAAGERILDAGCGTGAAMAAMLDRAPCRPVGLDTSATMLRAANRRLGGRAHLECAPIESMPFAAQSFDAVLALNVLYFEDAQGSLLSALYRVLKPGGRLVAYVTDADTMADWPFTRAGLHRLFDAASLKQALLRAGFMPDATDVRRIQIYQRVIGLIAHARC
jgi:ubiquinone/menaquinone biosynthesis C-methylase UbiE